jgi:hypothetical protein
MEKLGERNAYMISHAMKSCGYNKDNIIDLIQEDIYTREFIDVVKFITWICDNKIQCIEETLELKFQQWKTNSIPSFEKEIDNSSTKRI